MQGVSADNPLSLSARRAWIEIKDNISISYAPQSLSARRAWIEISICPGSWILPPVALRKESVDRNKKSVSVTVPKHRRSPQGERG